MTQQEKKFNNLLPKYRKEYKRVNGNYPSKMLFENGWVYWHFKGKKLTDGRVSDMEETMKRFSKMPTAPLWNRIFNISIHGRSFLNLLR